MNIIVTLKLTNLSFVWQAAKRDWQAVNQDRWTDERNSRKYMWVMNDTFRNKSLNECEYFMCFPSNRFQWKNHIEMKTPEHSRTSCVRYLLVLLPQNSLCGDKRWCHMMSRCHNVMSHVVKSLAMSLRWDQSSLNNAELLRNDISPGDIDLWPWPTIQA